MNSCWCLWLVPFYERLHNRPYSLRRGLTVFFPHFSISFLRVIFITVFLTQLTANLHGGSLVSCHRFRRVFSCLIIRWNPGRSWFFMSKSVTLHDDSLNAEAREAVKLRAALSASSSELTSILGDFETVPSLNFSTGSQRCLVLTWSSIWNTGRWSKSWISERITLDDLIFWRITVSSTSYFP